MSINRQKNKERQRKQKLSTIKNEQIPVFWLVYGTLEDVHKPQTMYM